MQIVQAPRASAILYQLLVGQRDIQPWLVPANICPIVPITFFKAGVPIVFVDISADTLHMDLKQAEDRLKRGAYGGLLYAHTYGEPSTPNDFFRYVKSNHPDLILVDDRCLCLPDLDPDPGMVADAALYSTGYAKIVELNFGGYAFLGDDAVYKAVSLPFNPEAHAELESGYKQVIQNREKYVYQDSDWLQTDAELAAWYDYRQQIKDALKASAQQRAKLNAIYEAMIPVENQLPGAYQSWRFNLRLKNKRSMLKAIFSAGLFASSHYASLVDIMGPGHGSQAEILANEIINLFNDRYFDTQKAEQVCKIIMENYS